MFQNYCKSYLSHARELLFSRLLARASVPASPILLPHNLEMQRNTVNENSSTMKHDILWETLTLSTPRFDWLSVPLPAALLLLLLCYCCLALKRRRLFVNLLVIGPTVESHLMTNADLKEMKTCLVFNK